MTPNYTIRQATIEDLPALRQLWIEYLDTMTSAQDYYPRNISGSIDDWTRSVARELVKVPATAFIFVAERDAKLIAFLLWEIMHRLLGEPHEYAYCHHLFVRPDARGQGVGPAISEVYLEHALAQGLAECEAGFYPGTTWVKSHPYDWYSTHGHMPIGRLLSHFDKRRAHHAALAATVGNGHDALVTAEPAKEPSDERDDG